MRGLMGRLGVGALAGLVLLAAAVRADDKAEKLTADKLPKAVAAAVKERFPGAEFTSITRENEGGKIVYDIELKHKGRKYEMDIHEDGTVIEIEKEVAAKDVPEAVTKALKAKYPTATVKEVMEVNKVKGKVETPDHYEVTLQTADNKSMEVLISLDGKKFLKEGGKE
jgi:Putative beta-lactamase-inhibitor-like, PepSY-like